MKPFWKIPGEKVFGLKDLDSDQLLYKVMPHFVTEIMRKYFRLEIEGLENIPKRGPAILAPNHSGFSGFDAFLIADSVYRGVHRVPRVLTHQFWFLTSATAAPAQKLGFIEATKENGRAQLAKHNLIVLFPEGEYGNFKPSSKRYRLQDFRRGFVRLALEYQCPIIPVVVLGAEETNVNLAQLKFTKFLKGTILPLPLNMLPLPARWKIKFLPPIELPYQPEAANDAELVHEIAADIREQLQKTINLELRDRGSAFFS
jgi:1-acyl-sn-glycerol-3-phosphate acyltransferase